jgi:hypothetical protein
MLLIGYAHLPFFAIFRPYQRIYIPDQHVLSMKMHLTDYHMEPIQRAEEGFLPLYHMLNYLCAQKKSYVLCRNYSIRFYSDNLRAIKPASQRGH